MFIKRTTAFPVILIMLIFLLAACANPQVESNHAAESTGIAELDALIKKVLSGNIDEVRSLLEFIQTTCTTVEGLGGPPKCLAGEADGTPVEVLPFLGSEGHFIRKDDIESWTGLEVSELFAAYQVSDKAYSDKDYPAGEYALVFTGGSVDKTSTTLQVRGGRIVRIDNGPGYPPLIHEQDVARYLVTPINPNP